MKLKYRLFRSYSKSNNKNYNVRIYDLDTNPNYYEWLVDFGSKNEIAWKIIQSPENALLYRKHKWKNIQRLCQLSLQYDGQIVEMTYEEFKPIKESFKNTYNSFNWRMNK